MRNSVNENEYLPIIGKLYYKLFIVRTFNKIDMEIRIIHEMLNEETLAKVNRSIKNNSKNAKFRNFRRSQTIKSSRI